MDDPYKILGIARSASADQIKSAYRKLARGLHPDLNPNDKHAEERFKRVNSAYDLLSDPPRRARFDAGEIDAEGNETLRGRASKGGFSGGFGGGGGGFRFGDNADDILSELLRRKSKGGKGGSSGGGGFGGFGFGGGGDKGGAESSSRRGGDAQYSLKVSFTEAALGGTKRITLPTGKSLDVKVPPGSKDGAVLRLKKQGHPGVGGADAGDALVEIKVDPHPFFTRDGLDVLLTLPITLGEAMLGGKVPVPTLDGKVVLNVPPRSGAGGVLRLKGKGIAAEGGQGDLLVTLKVVLPDQPEPELEQFLRSWSPRSGYDVRGKMGIIE